VANPVGDEKSLHAAYVDMGTTNTRVWLGCGEQIVASLSDALGIRDAAREGNQRVRRGLADLITRLRHEADSNGKTCTPQCIVAAGMIGSNLGLVEVPYVQPPAGIEELTAAAGWHRFSDISDLPMLLVPGVRCGPTLADKASISQVDVMRGEETLCAGLVELGLVTPPTIVLNLGSHWKAIQLDPDGKIRSSITSLSGELIHAVQSHTVIAGSLSSQRPERLSPEWIEAGMTEQGRSGLARALFCTRLLDLGRHGSPEDRLAFVVGAFIASDLYALVARDVLTPGARVALVGHAALGEAWQTALSRMQIAATIVTQQEAETALLGALRRILAGALLTRESNLRASR
jgi:2-dehydro-3-deoxygalactonokinase